MATWVDYRGMQVPDSSTGDAGIRLTDNFTELAERAAPVNFTATTDPDANDDVDAGFYAGSHWLNTATPEMWICLDNTADAAVWQSIGGVTSNARDILTADRTYYVRTDGDDSNDGLSNTSGGAFLTIQHAIDVIMTLDIRDKTVTIQVEDGTYSGGNLVDGPWLGDGVVELVGNISTPANVIVTAATEPAIYVRDGGRLTISGLEVRTTAGTYSGVHADKCGIVVIGDSVRFGNCTQDQMLANGGGNIIVDADYTVCGGAQAHVCASGLGYIDCHSHSVTITGTPAFTVGFAYASRGGVIEHYWNTFSGSATGQRYFIDSLGLVFTDGTSTSYLPGNSAGSTTSGGVYA